MQHPGRGKLRLKHLWFPSPSRPVGARDTTEDRCCDQLKGDAEETALLPGWREKTTRRGCHPGFKGRFSALLGVGMEAPRRREARAAAQRSGTAWLSNLVSRLAAEWPVVIPRFPAATQTTVVHFDHASSMESAAIKRGADGVTVPTRHRPEASVAPCLPERLLRPGDNVFCTERT